MTRRRDLMILLGLLLALIVFTILGPGSTEEENRSYIPTTHSSAPGGALALLRWTQAMGYDARRLEYTAFALDQQTEALFMLNPTQSVNRTEAQEVLEWVEAGGTLILVDDRTQLFAARNEILRALEIQVRPYEGEQTSEIMQAPVLQPVFDRPPLRLLPVETERVLDAERQDVVRLIGVEDGTVLAGLRQGQGYIYLSSASLPFTNEGLRDEQSAALMLNLLRRVSAGGRILFDEYHHGFFTPPSLRSIVLGSAWGWALIYTLVVLASYFLLGGRRFGRPVPLPEDVSRRSSIEYVESMADLFQRGGQRAFILRHYYTAFKRRLAKPYGINPALDNASFVAELARQRVDIDQAALLALLNRLQQEQIREDELLRTAAETVTDWIRK